MPLGEPVPELFNCITSRDGIKKYTHITICRMKSRLPGDNFGGNKAKHINVCSLVGASVSVS